MHNNKKFDWLLLFELLLSIFILFAVYEIFAVTMQIGFVFWVYYGALIVLPIVYAAANYGFTRHKVTRDMLPDAWSDEEKDKYINEAAVRRRKTRILIVLFCGFAFAMLYDVTELFFPQYIDPVKGVIEKWLF